MPIGDWPFPFLRFFARISGMTLSCPMCGNVIVVGAAGGVKGHSGGVFDKSVSTIRCNQCSKIFQVGVIAWEIKPAPGFKGGIRLPEDQRPNFHEQAALRMRAGGFWAREVKKRVDDPVNRFIRGECCCDPLPWQPECPVHGNERGTRRTEKEKGSPT